MIAKGSKIRLVKPMGIFDNVGEICDVIHVTENGVITFKFGGYHIGCMSYDEFEKYFENYNDVKPKKVSKRKWSDWEYDTFIYYDFSGKNHTVPVRFRTNGKIVDLRTDWDNVSEHRPNLRAKASCNKNDKFDFDAGLDLADARMQIKLMQRDLEDMIDEM